MWPRPGRLRGWLCVPAAAPARGDQGPGSGRLETVLESANLDATRDEMRVLRLHDAVSSAPQPLARGPRNLQGRSLRWLSARVPLTPGVSSRCSQADVGPAPRLRTRRLWAAGGGLVRAGDSTGGRADLSLNLSRAGHRRPPDVGAAVRLPCGNRGTLEGRSPPRLPQPGSRSRASGSTPVSPVSTGFRLRMCQVQTRWGPRKQNRRKEEGGVRRPRGS